MFRRWTDVRVNNMVNLALIVIVPLMAFVQYAIYLNQGGYLHLVVSLLAIIVTILNISLSVSKDSPMRFKSGCMYRQRNSPEKTRDMVHQFLRRHRLRYYRVERPKRFMLQPYTEVLYLERRQVYIGMHRHGLVIFTYEPNELEVERLKVDLMELFGP